MLIHFSAFVCGEALIIRRFWKRELVILGRSRLRMVRSRVIVGRWPHKIVLSKPFFTWLVVLKFTVFLV
jgi:hypothetical protein